MEDQHFFYRENGELKQLFWGEIVYLTAKDNHTIFTTTQGDIHIRVTLNDAMKLLPKSYFVRLNRSTAVAFQHIDRIKGDSVFLRTEPLKELTLTTECNKTFLKQIVILQTDTNKRKKRKSAEDEEIK